jgi:hypothetical protein
LELARNPQGLEKMSTSDSAILMAQLDYSMHAELFSWKGRQGARQPIGYKRFASAAEAIRFAIEDLPPPLLNGAYLEVDETRYDGAEIRRLYESPGYPLARRAAGPPK